MSSTVYVLYFIGVLSTMFIISLQKPTQADLKSLAERSAGMTDKREIAECMSFVAYRPSVI